MSKTEHKLTEQLKHHEIEAHEIKVDLQGIRSKLNASIAYEEELEQRRIAANKRSCETVFVYLLTMEKRKYGVQFRRRAQGAVPAKMLRATNMLIGDTPMPKLCKQFGVRYEQPRRKQESGVT
jgi:hypothetical protein